MNPSFGLYIKETVFCSWLHMWSFSSEMCVSFYLLVTLGILPNKILGGGMMAKDDIILSVSFLQCTGLSLYH